MTYTTVQSSAIRQLGYDAKTGECEITFHSGGTERKNLTAEQYKAFLNADSIGLHYAKHIKTQAVKPVIAKQFKMKR